MTDRVKSEEIVKSDTKPEGIFIPASSLPSNWKDVAKRILIQVVSVDGAPADPRRVYPKTVAECIDDNLKYKIGVYAAIKQFRNSQPWKGSQEEMQAKFQMLNAELAGIYKIDKPNLVFVKQFPAGPCCITNSKPAVIMMEETKDGNYSVVAFLHEFGHSIGLDEKGTCRWSLNLFKRFFPKAFAALEPKGHLLFKRRDKKNKDQGVDIRTEQEKKSNVA
jgi:hypothetical protein